MPEERRADKKEVDANEVIRDYVESAKTESDVHQTNMEWYEQASQDTNVPPEAVLTGGDIDAAWDQAAAGEETVGGSSPTPDQDIVDEIGKAVGVGYEDGEPTTSPSSPAPAPKRKSSSVTRGKRKAA